MPEQIKSAKTITIFNLVVCRSMLSKIPEKLTIPVIKISPTDGKFLLTPAPGSKGPSPRVTKPICGDEPREASIATIRH